MAADVSTGQSGDEKKELVTRDLLGSCSSGSDDKEIWEKKLEFLSRKSNCSVEPEADRELHDLNLPPPPPPVPSFASVCTLEKVKSALERAMRDAGPNPNRKSDGSPSPSMKRRMDGEDRWSVEAMMVTVCPGCFQYLLIPKADPWCPKCAAHVPDPDMGKKKAKMGNY